MRLEDDNELQSSKRQKRLNEVGGGQCRKIRWQLGARARYSASAIYSGRARAIGHVLAGSLSFQCVPGRALGNPDRRPPRDTDVAFLDASSTSVGQDHAMVRARL